jgi:phosphate-selective porin OprO and OprP
MRIAVLTLAVVLALPSFAQSIEERLAKLEQEMRELRAENAELRRQLGVQPEPATPPAPPPPVVRPAGKEPRLTVGGFFHGQAESGGRVDSRFDENDRVYFRRARVNVQGGFAEHVDFKAEVEIGGNTLGGGSNFRAQGTDLYAHWKRYPAAQVRFGQFKTPYSFEQLYSDTLISTPERALGVDRIAIGRQLGVQLMGDLAGKRVSYAIGAFNGNGINSSANDDDGFLVAARLSATLLERGKLRWSGGVNGYRSEDRGAAAPPEAGLPNNTFAGTRHAWGIDTQLTTERLELMTEYLRAEYDPTAATERDLSALYILGGWFFTPKWEGVLRYETYDAVTADTDVWTGGANYLFKGHDLKLQLHLMHSDDGDRIVARVQTLF